MAFLTNLQDESTDQAADDMGGRVSKVVIGQNAGSILTRNRLKEHEEHSEFIRSPNNARGKLHQADVDKLGRDVASNLPMPQLEMIGGLPGSKPIGSQPQRSD